MPTSYTPKVVVTRANRSRVCDRVATLFQHLDNLNVNLLSLVRNDDGTYTFTFDKPIPAEQLEHLGLADRDGSS